mmetsp:Transcript_47849/g.113696  ORF Transcript_47849/g.113696 Transcript_47849/m.113696 type:complete len:200 (-) Transcript_47849:336-935(-)
MYASTKSPSGVSKVRPQTGQVPSLRQTNVSKSKHCRCWQAAPRAGVLMRVSDKGHVSDTRSLPAPPAASCCCISSTTFALLSLSFSTGTFLQTRFAASFSRMLSCRSDTSGCSCARRAAAFSLMISRRFSAAAAASSFEAGRLTPLLLGTSPPPPPLLASLALNSRFFMMVTCSMAHCTRFAFCFWLLPMKSLNMTLDF